MPYSVMTFIFKKMINTMITITEFEMSRQRIKVKSVKNDNLLKKIKK